MKKPKKILICRPDRIGDVILATPLIRELKKSFPECTISILVNPYTADLLKNNPHIDNIIIDDPKDNQQYRFFDQVKYLRKYSFDYAFMLLPTERIAWMLFFAGIPHRFGVGTKLYQVITFTKSVSRHKYIPLRHEADYCMDFGRKLGINPDSINPEIFITEEEKNVITRNYFRDNISSEKLTKKVCIHPGSNNSAPNISIKKYCEIINALLNYENVHIFLTGSSSENHFISDLEKLKSPRLSILIGKLGLRELCSLISLMNVVVSSSTGPMHIAASLKIPTVSFFCTLPACSSQLWGPLGNENCIILPNQEFCIKSCKNDPHHCTLDGGLESENIVNEILKILN